MFQDLSKNFIKNFVYFMKNGKFIFEKNPQVLLFDLIFLTLSLLENVFIFSSMFSSSSLKMS